MNHLSNDEIEQFLAARLGPAGQQKVVRHLLAGCGVCGRKLAERAPHRLLEEESEEGRRRRITQTSARGRAIALALRRDALWKSDESRLGRSLELLQSTHQVDG